MNEQQNQNKGCHDRVDTFGDGILPQCGINLVFSDWLLRQRRRQLTSLEDLHQRVNFLTREVTSNPAVFTNRLQDVGSRQQAVIEHDAQLGLERCPRGELLVVRAKNFPDPTSVSVNATAGEPILIEGTRRERQIASCHIQQSIVNHQDFKVFNPLPLCPVSQGLARQQLPLVLNGAVKQMAPVFPFLSVPLTHIHTEWVHHAFYVLFSRGRR